MMLLCGHSKNFSICSYVSILIIIQLQFLAEHDEPLRALVDASVARTATLTTEAKRQFRLCYMVRFLM